MDPSPLLSSAEFEKLLSHNDPPDSDALTHKIAAERQAQLARLAAVEIDLAVNEINARRRELEQEKVGVLQRVASCDKVMSPMRRLPTEITRQIFLVASLLALEEEKEKKGAPSTARWLPRDASYNNIIPWTLTHVCRRWRDICVAYPTLWSNLVFRDSDIYSSDPTSESDDSDSDGGDSYECGSDCVHCGFKDDTLHGWSSSLLLALHLAHSQQQPLFITISSSTHVPKRSPILRIQVLLRTSPRWKALNVSIPLSYFKSIAPIRKRLPSLVSLRILPDDLISSPGEIAYSPLQNLFQHATELSDLSGGRTVLSTACFPRQRIKRYHESILSLTGNVSWLEDFVKMENLVDCTFRPGLEDTIAAIAAVDSFPKLLLGKFQLLHLERLTIHFCHDVEQADATTLLSRFDFPALTHLSISCAAEKFATTTWSSTFSEFPTLHYLEIRGKWVDTIPGYEVPILLSGLPVLKILSLGDCFELDDAFMEEILQPNFVPALTRIEWQRAPVGTKEEEQESFVARYSQRQGPPILHLD